MHLSTALFYVCSAIILVCGLRVVTARNVFHAALYLASALAALAVLYLLMNAEFLAVVQLLVYVGAVIVLIIFAVMLTAKVGEANSQTNRLALPAALGSIALFVVLQRWLLATPWAAAQASPAADQDTIAASLNNLQALGLSLFSRYVYPLELTALILFTALIGAVLIARKDQA